MKNIQLAISILLMIPLLIASCNKDVPPQEKLDIPEPQPVTSEAEAEPAGVVYVDQETGEVISFETVDEYNAYTLERLKEEVEATATDPFAI